MKNAAATTLPDGPDKPMKKEAATGMDWGAGEDIELLSGSGTQKSLNPKKDQPKTMRYLR